MKNLGLISEETFEKDPATHELPSQDMKVFVNQGNLNQASSKLIDRGSPLVSFKHNDSESEIPTFLDPIQLGHSASLSPRMNDLRKQEMMMAL